MLRPPSLPDRPFTFRQAEELGISRHQLRTLVDSGRLRRVFTNVYQRHDLPDTVENRAAAATLILPPFGVVADRSAAWIHGVDAFDYRELEILPPLEVRVLRHHPARNRKSMAGGTRDLDPIDVMTVGGVRVTTPLRTAMDLGCHLSGSSALAALDQFMRIHGITYGDLDAELPRFRRRRGVVQLRKLIVWASPLAESPGESWTRYYMERAGLPTPTLQFSIVVNGRELYRLDHAYPHHLVCVEFDGRLFHDSDEARAADEARRTWLREHGWTVIVVTKDDLGPEARGRWLAEVNQALRGW